MYTTNTDLLRAVAGNNEVSWTEFYRCYKPFMLNISKDYSRFLTNSEREELVQLTMQSIFEGESVKKFDKSKGSFRTYLQTIIRRNLFTMLRKKGSDKERSLTYTDQLESSALDEDFEKKFSEEYNQYVLNLMLDDLREHVETQTYEIFQMYVLRAKSAQEVAKMFDVSLSAVYSVRSRCVKYLQDLGAELCKDDPDLKLKLDL